MSDDRGVRLALALLPLLLAGKVAGSRPAGLVALWVEEGQGAELRITLRGDGRAVKARQRKCLPTTADDEPCVPFRYDGTWEASARQLVLHLPGGMDERFSYALKGNLLYLTDRQGKQSHFVSHIPEADGANRPQKLCGKWIGGPRSIQLLGDGGYRDIDEDGEVAGTWRADAEYLTLSVPNRDPMSYRYRLRAGALVIEDATRRVRTFRLQR
jgi:hypothetical protein